MWLSRWVPVSMVVLTTLGLPMGVAIADGSARTSAMPPLHQAVLDARPELVAELVDAGTDPNVTNDYGVTPLSIACTSGDATMVEQLLRLGANPNQKLSGAVTCLMRAARSGSVEIIDSLIAHGANVNDVQRNGQTALMFAAVEGHAAVCQTLIDHGADVQRKIDEGFTAMHLAARQGHVDAVMTLLDAGMDVDATMSPKQTSGRNPRKGMTALMLAVESGHFELAMRLVDRGADPNDESSGFAPLHAISWVRRAQLGDNPAGDPEPRGSGDLTSLQFVEALVAAGADVNLRLHRGRGGRAKLNQRGATPLLMACHTLDVPLMDLLLKLGADPMIANQDGTTTLLAVAGIGVVNPTDGYPGTYPEFEIAWKRLLELGLDVNVVDGNGETTMHGAAYRNWPDAVHLVGSSGADRSIWNAKNKYGWTPKMIAQGHRPGSFKPDPPTIAAIEEWMQ